MAASVRGVVESFNSCVESVNVRLLFYRQVFFATKNLLYLSFGMIPGYETSLFHRFCMQLSRSRQALILLIPVALTLLLILVQPAHEPVLRALAPSPVLVSPAQRVDLYPEVRVSGHLQPARRAWLRFEVEGVVAERRAEPGQTAPHHQDVMFYHAVTSGRRTTTYAENSDSPKTMHTQKTIFSFFIPKSIRIVRIPNSAWKMRRKTVVLSNSECLCNSAFWLASW